MQNEFLEEFMRQFKSPSYRKVASMTGLNVSRVFRIFSGSEMKYNEYLAFKKLIVEEEFTISDELVLKLTKDLQRLNKDFLQEIGLLVQNKLNLQQLLSC